MLLHTKCGMGGVHKKKKQTSEKNNVRFYASSKDSRTLPDLHTSIGLR